MATVLNIDAIVSDPAIRGGRPSIAGTRICVSDIIAYHLYDRQSAEELAAGFKLPLGHVHAALAYYYMHQDEIDSEMQASAKESAALIEELKSQGKVINFD